MISLSQILPRAQRHTSFTVTSGLAVATETRGGGYREVGGVSGFGWSVYGASMCAYGVGVRGCRLGDGVGGSA